jgi:hypothetical protein
MIPAKSRYLAIPSVHSKVILYVGETIAIIISLAQLTRASMYPGNAKSFTGSRRERTYCTRSLHKLVVSESVIASRRQGAVGANGLECTHGGKMFYRNLLSLAFLS